MDFLTLAKKRYSVREYSERAVEKEKLNMILEAAKIAPSAGNVQPIELIVVQAESGLDKISKTANLYGAPCAVIICVDMKKSWKRSYDGKLSGEVDAGIATDHMMLAATDLGMGTVCINYFDPKKIKEEFKLPDVIEPVTILAIGYGEGESRTSERHHIDRKDLEEIVHFEHY